MIFENFQYLLLVSLTIMSILGQDCNARFNLANILASIGRKGFQQGRLKRKKSSFIVGHCHYNYNIKKEWKIVINAADYWKAINRKKLAVLSANTLYIERKRACRNRKLLVDNFSLRLTWLFASVVQWQINFVSEICLLCCKTRASLLIFYHFIYI